MGKNELEPWLVEFSRLITDRDKVKPMQSRFFFLPSIKNGSMMHFILPWIHHVQGFRRVLQILWFPKKFNFRFGFKQYVLLSYLKALDATDDVPVFTGRSKFPKLQGTGCKNSLRHVSSTNRLLHRDCSWNKSPRFALSLRSTQKLLNTSALNSPLFLSLRVNLFDLAFQPPPKSRRKKTVYASYWYLTVVHAANKSQ